MGYTNLAYLEEVSGGNKDFVKDIVGLFLDQTPKLMAEIDMAINQQKWDEVAGSAHKLKSSLKMLGVYDLEDALVNIETNAKKKENLEEIPSTISEVKTITQKVIEELNAN